MMYHFMFGLRGGSPASTDSAPDGFMPSVCSVASFFSSSGIVGSCTVRGKSFYFLPRDQRCVRYLNNWLMPVPIVLSMIQKYRPNRNTVMMTTVVVACTSFID